MTAINQAHSRTKLYGWVDPTLNFSTSADQNAPEANDVYSNRFEMNQFVLYAERLPDSVQRDHIDWGYHLTALYGTDDRFTIAKGYLSGQFARNFDAPLPGVYLSFPSAKDPDFQRRHPGKSTVEATTMPSLVLCPEPILSQEEVCSCMLISTHWGESRYLEGNHAGKEGRRNRSEEYRCGYCAWYGVARDSTGC